MSSDKVGKLVKMANQIGAAFESLPGPEAARNAAAHMKQFWTPKMIREMVEAGTHGDAGLNATAKAALAVLADG